MSEALILASTNPQYDKRFFLELRVQYMKIPSSEHVENMLCTQIGFCFDIQNNLCTYVLDMFWTCNWMNNLLSYCGLVDARISASEKDLPVLQSIYIKLSFLIKIVHNVWFRSMFSAAHTFGHVEFWKSNICFCFLQEGTVEKIKTIILNYKFDTSKSMSCQGKMCKNCTSENA